MLTFDKSKATLILFAGCCFANGLAALLIHFLGLSSYVLLALKDIILFVMIFISLVFFGVRKDDVIYILAVALYGLVFFLISLFKDVYSIAALAGLRQIITVFLIFFMGALLSSKIKESQKNTINYIVSVGVIVAVIGVVERFTHLWSPFITEYFELKNIAVLSVGYPFVLIEPTLLFNEFEGVTGILRASSTVSAPKSAPFFQPLTAAH
jgi:hypothetical protein